MNSLFIQDMICGTFSGVGNCLSGYVFDTLKVRMQMDHSLTMLKAMKKIIKTEGTMQLFNGIKYPLFTVPIINAVLFGAYELFKKLSGKQELSFINGIQNGAFAGLVNAVIVTPVELVKCHMQLDKTNKFNSSTQCAKHIFRTEGVRGLFRGGSSTAFRQVFAYAAQFATYELLKNEIISEKHPHLSLAEGIAVGLFAGLNCWIFSYPQDIVKTMIQVSKKGTYKTVLGDGGFIDCSRQLYKLRGWKGFWIGIEPCLVRAAVANAIGIAIYEQSQKHFTHNDYLQNY